MADNVVVYTGSGAVVSTEDIVNGIELGVTKLDVGAHDVSSRVVERGITHALPVTENRRWVRVPVNVPLTQGNYYYGSSMGGLLTLPNVFARSTGGYGTVEQITGFSNSPNASYFYARFFDSPPVATITDQQTPVFTATDQKKVTGQLRFPNAPSFGGMFYLSLIPAEENFVSLPVRSSDTNLYLMLVASGGYIYSNDILYLCFYIRTD